MTKTMYTDSDPEPPAEVTRLVEIGSYDYYDQPTGAFIDRVGDGWLFVPGPDWYDDKNGRMVTEEDRTAFGLRMLDILPGGKGWSWPPRSASAYQVWQDR